MTFDVAASIAQLEHRLGANADPEVAESQSAYMRNNFAFYGIKSPALNTLAKEVLTEIPTQPELARFARACWDQPEREWQYLACGLLRRHVKSCDETLLPVTKTFITTKSWWDTIDTLASHTVGGLVAVHPILAAEMDAWIASDNIWVARSALLHQLGYKTHTDADRLFRYCQLRASDDEFFIRKAIGWALRTYSRVDGRAVRAFVEDTALSGLSKREALKWLDR